LDLELCKSFLEGLWEKSGSLCPGDERQLELEKSFDNAVKLVGDPGKTDKWKAHAIEIRTKYNANRLNQAREVRI